MGMTDSGTANSRLALGTAQFGLPYGIANDGGRVAVDEARRIMGFARDNGIDTLDTAIAYGESEAVLGGIGVDRWKVISKLPSVPAECADIPCWIEDQVHASLQRLRIDALHGLLLHRPFQLIEPEGELLYELLCRLRERGIVEKIGISIHGPQELDTLCATMRFDLIQAPMSVVDRRIAESGWAERLRTQGCELHARSIFLQGLLLMAEHRRPAYFDRWRPLWDSWEEWLRSTGQTPLEACVRCVLEMPPVAKLVIGADSLAQLEEIVAAAGSAARVSSPASPRCDDLDLILPARWRIA